MHLQLDGRGPLHAQLTRALKSAVFANRVGQGARLPATRTLEHRAALLEGLRRCGEDRVEVADSNAGMHLVAWLAGKSADEGDACIAHARALGLGLYSIAPYHLDPPDRAGLLLGYASMPVAEIREAMKLFETCLRET